MAVGLCDPDRAATDTGTAAEHRGTDRSYSCSSRHSLREPSGGTASAPAALGAEFGAVHALNISHPIP